MPSVETASRLLAFRTILGVLDELGHPARSLSLYILGQSLRVLVSALWMAGDKYLKGEDVFEMMEKFASRFQISAIQPGDAVFTMLHNSLVNVAAALSLSFVGGVLFLADHELCNGKENEALDISKIKKKDALYVRHVPGSEDVMAVLYTSGSTRSPRGVPITHRAYVSSFESYRALEHVSAEDVFLAWTPLANNFGFSLNVFPMLLGVFTVFKEPTMTHIAFTAAMSRNDIMPPQDDSEPNCEGCRASIGDAYGSIAGAFKRTTEVYGRIGESYETIEDALDFGSLPKIKGHVNETKRTIREGIKEPSQVLSHGSGQSAS
ncbi:hypothetical protein HPB47_020404 [Ixodes persulcatus]|uniref:Uncharacterized protein n=1 Tax=Ixodes persulcatus TaxID=34615 RepID=A0AC60QFM0_IXOPE|nr:hypothetical protein HPB47_020404 [Ixodes persulcatus]